MNTAAPTTTHATEYMRGYADGIESMPRGYMDDPAVIADSYLDGYTMGTEARRIIEEEAGYFIERRIKAFKRKAKSRVGA